MAVRRCSDRTHGGDSGAKCMDRQDSHHTQSFRSNHPFEILEWRQMLHASSLQYAMNARQYAMESRAHSLHLSNLLSQPPSPLPVASRYCPKSGTNSASGTKRLALDLAVLPAILRISLDQ